MNGCAADAGGLWHPGTNVPGRARLRRAGLIAFFMVKTCANASGKQGGKLLVKKLETFPLYKEYYALYKAHSSLSKVRDQSMVRDTALHQPLRGRAMPHSGISLTLSKATAFRRQEQRRPSRRACRSPRKVRPLPLSKLLRSGCSNLAGQCGTLAWTTLPRSSSERRSSSSPSTSPHAQGLANLPSIPVPTSSRSSSAGRCTCLGASDRRRQARLPPPGRRASRRYRGALHLHDLQVRAPTDQSLFYLVPVYFLRYYFRYPGTCTSTSSSLSSTTILSQCTSPGPLY